MHFAFVGAVVLVAIFLLAACALWVNDRLLAWVHRDRRTDDQKRYDEEALASRLLNPRWDQVTAATGGRPSPALLDLYSDYQLLLKENLSVRCDLEIEEQLTVFRPADAIALQAPWCDYLPRTAFPFAHDIFGDFLFVELTPEGHDQPVKHWYHDGGNVETVAPSLATFLLWCRDQSRLNRG